ncbi:MAG: hypothetical protein DCC71_24795, partial [Proteobacteria bacterium]
ALEAGRAPGRVPAPSASATETLLLVRADEPAARFGRLPALRVEPLAPLVATFLDAARTPIDGAGLDAFARASDLSREAIDAVVAEFVADGVLVRGRP